MQWVVIYAPLCPNNPHTPFSSRTEHIQYELSVVIPSKVTFPSRRK